MTRIEPRLTAAEAAAEISPSGQITPRLLADAMRDGRLDSERIGKRRYTTLSWVKEWLKRCREGKPAPASTGTDSARSGSSETERGCGALAAARATVRELKGLSRSTLQKRGGRQQQPEKRAS